MNGRIVHMRCRGQVVEQAPRSQRKEERYGALDYFTHQRDGGHDWHRNDKASCDEGYSAHLIAREAAQFIRASKQPFFLYVPFNAVHAPLMAPEKCTAPYAPLTGLRRAYAGMLAAMDESIGQIMAALDEK